MPRLAMHRRAMPDSFGWHSRHATSLAIATVSAYSAALLGYSPVSCDGWLGVRGSASVLMSVGLGLWLAVMTITVSRNLVHRTKWAKALCVALQPPLSGIGGSTLVAAAVGGALGEELLFRGLLVPVLGILGSSILFGAVHRICGEGRWGWMAWATIMGLLFGSIFEATGSIAGAVVAHAAVNLYNFRFLRDFRRPVQARPLGGLLHR